MLTMKHKTRSKSTPKTISKQTLLRTGLATNAVFSTLCAILFLAYDNQLAELMGQVNPLLLQTIGVSLLIFVVELFCQIIKKRLSTLRALIVSIADLTWVMASLALLVIWPNILTGSGATIVALVAAVVLICALLQLSGINRIHRVSGRTTYRHCVPMEVEASAESLWRIIGDLDSIAQYAPHIASSQLADGEISGLGSVRNCQDENGKQWSERCTAYEPGHRLELRFLTEVPDFPLPVKKMDGGWELEALAENRSEVRVWWEMEPKVKPFALLLMPIFGYMMDRQFKVVMDNMAGTEKPMRAKGLARLLPLPC